MDDRLPLLRETRDRALREFLAMEGWVCPKEKVKVAAAEMLESAMPSTAALIFLLDQIKHLPLHLEPARRLNELTQAIVALNQANESPLPNLPSRPRL